MGTLDIAAAAAEWDEVASASGEPCLSTAWLVPWTASYASSARWLVLRDQAGAMLAGACLVPTWGGGLRSAANIETSLWDVVAVDDAAREHFWRELLAQHPSRLDLRALPAGSHTALVVTLLRQHGYLVHQKAELANPRRTLPAPQEWEASLSRNLRRRYRRAMDGLAAHGEVRLRTSVLPEEVNQDLDTFLRIEASGWKGRSGRPILGHPRDEPLYRRFVQDLAHRGQARVSLLEVGGTVAAASFEAVQGDCMFAVKTAYDERWSEHSPGLVLALMTMRRASEEGLRTIDLGGGPGTMKERLGARPGLLCHVRAFRGPFSPLGWYYVYLRPQLKRVRNAGRAIAARRPAIRGR